MIRILFVPRIKTNVGSRHVSVAAPTFWNTVPGKVESTNTVMTFLPQDLHVVERSSSVVECRTRNQVSPGSNRPLLPFGRLCIFLLSIDAPVDLAV